MNKYLIMALPIFILNIHASNVYANDIESELGANNPIVNTKTMQAARYICHAFFGLAAKVTDSQKVDHMPQKIAQLSAHCAKGNFHQALTESGLADEVHLDPHPAFSHIHDVLDGVHVNVMGGDPSTYTPRNAPEAALPKANAAAGFFGKIRGFRTGGPGSVYPVYHSAVRKISHWEYNSLLLHHTGNQK